MKINRSWDRTEHDDFVLNVQPKLDKTTVATPLYYLDSQGSHSIIAWKIHKFGD